jgi:hypothetical protein
MYLSAIVLVILGVFAAIGIICTLGYFFVIRPRIRETRLRIERWEHDRDQILDEFERMYKYTEGSDDSDA